MILYRQKYFGEEDERKGMGWGKKLAIGLGTTAALGYGAKKGMFGARAQVGINNQIGKLGGRMSNSGSTTLQKLGNNVMTSAKADYGKGFNKLATNSAIKKIDPKLTGDAAKKALETAKSTGTRFANGATNKAANSWSQVGKSAEAIVAGRV